MLSLAVEEGSPIGVNPLQVVERLLPFLLSVGYGFLPILTAHYYLKIMTIKDNGNNKEQKRGDLD